MSRIISSSNPIQEAMRVGLWFVVFGLAITAHAAQSKEGSFTLKKRTLMTKIVNSGARWLPSYQLDARDVRKGLKNSVSTGVAFSSASRLLPVADPQKDDWSVSIQKQFPSSNDCSRSSGLLCFDSKNEGTYNKLQHDSYWLVLRKTFHF